MRRILKLKLILPCIQAFLSLVALIIDKSFNHGLGEGENQIWANLVSNIEFLFKLFLGYDDIANYNFRILTVLLAIGIWYLIGLSIDKIIGKFRIDMKVAD